MPDTIPGLEVDPPPAARPTSYLCALDLVEAARAGEQAHLPAEPLRDAQVRVLEAMAAAGCASGVAHTDTLASAELTPGGWGLISTLRELGLANASGIDVDGLVALGLIARFARESFTHQAEAARE